MEKDWVELIDWVNASEPPVTICGYQMKKLVNSEKYHLLSSILITHNVLNAVLNLLRKPHVQFTALMLETGSYELEFTLAVLCRNLIQSRIMPINFCAVILLNE